MSEHIIVVLPKVSTEGRFLIMAFSSAILLTLSARAMVTRAGSPSGIAATAIETEARKMNTGSWPARRPPTKVNTARTATVPERYTAKDDIFFCNGVTISSASLMHADILLICVLLAVHTTTPRPLP